MTPPSTAGPATTVIEELGHTKRKRVAWKHEVNGCLCGNVVQPSDLEAVRCKQAGCETEWVSTSTCYQLHSSLEVLLIDVVSIILHA